MGRTLALVGTYFQRQSVQALPAGAAVLGLPRPDCMSAVTADKPAVLVGGQRSKVRSKPAIRAAKRQNGVFHAVSHCVRGRSVARETPGSGTRNLAEKESNELGK